MIIDFTPLINNTPILIASDYDGTIAPFVPDPKCAFPDPSVWHNFLHLGQLPQVHLALLSGRGRSELLSLSKLGDRGIAIGSHGGELPDGAQVLTPDQENLKEIIHTQFNSFAATLPGALVEDKPTGVTLHVRASSDQAGEQLLSHAHNWLTNIPNIRIIPGNKVLEVALITADKGSGLAYLVDTLHVQSALYIGDDKTDEDGFRWLNENMPHNVTIKVGTGPTVARYRVDTIDDVGGVFTQLGDELRSQNN